VLREEGYSERAIFVIDRFGIIRFIDMHDIDDQPKNGELFAVLKSIDPEAAAHFHWEEEEIPEELPHGGIVMYCTSWCPGCRKARAWFGEHKLPYKEIDITKNRIAAAQVKEWAGGNETTPTFDIDGAILVDYDEARLTEILKDKLKK
jgi:glutaredoxin